MMKVWLHFFSQEEPQAQETIIAALVSVGLETSPLLPTTSAGPGILIFTEVTQVLCRFLQEASHNGLNRVLAIATSRACLAGGDTWALLQAGASDVLAWDRAQLPAAAVVARFERWQAVDRLVESPLVRQSLVGESRAWKSLLRQVVEAARFTDASVLILGESGTGKELAARLIHTLDPRPQKYDLVVVDCTTIVPELAGSEFFGHERGAFTGAVAARDGAFALADGGTLFLDEVGDLPLGLQAQLLRVVQEGTYKRVGGNTWHRTNFRLVAATNKDLQQAVSCGAFRRDLYYRIAGVTCQLPSLRERAEDILPLTYHFGQQLRSDKEAIELDDLVREYLLSRTYSGNVRDLRQLVARIIYRHVGSGPITVGDIPEEERPAINLLPDWPDHSLENAIQRALAGGVGLKEISRAVTEAAIRIAIRNEEGNLQRAARKLGVTDRALQLRRAARREPEQPQDEGASDSLSSAHSSPLPEQSVLAS
jgi:transcriptional regulator with GAF, ATPase, and Fis domain